MGRRKNLYLLVLFLAAAHLLYAPAWQAGWTRDVTGWLQSLHTKTFGDYLLRRGLRVESLYPFTQWMLWVWWKLFGVHPLPWHLLMVSLHAVCAWGWAKFYSRVLESKISGNFAGLLFLFSPYATEVVVWEAGYHYLQGMVLLLATLFALLHYLTSGKKRWIFVGLIAFLPTLFALETFYLAPIYAALLLLYFWKNARTKKAVGSFVVPMLALCAVQYGLFRWLYTEPVPHIKTLTWLRLSDYLRKPAKYFFNLFLFGRYWPQNLRAILYDVLNSWAFLGGFYASLITLIFRKRKALKSFQKHPVFIPATFAIAALLLVVPLYFQESGLVDFDRYTYFMLPAVGAIFGHYFRKKWLRVGIMALSAGLLFYTNLLWQKSAALSREMLLKIPDFKDGKPTLLLNIPDALRGLPMIGYAPEGEAALLRRYVLEKPFSGIVLEAGACQISSPKDMLVETAWRTPQALEIKQLNGDGWWADGILTPDFENNLFSVRFSHPNRSYVLTLKKPAADFHVLQWNGVRWAVIKKP